MAKPAYELVVRWPSKAGDLRQLETISAYPLARTPRQVDLHDSIVWVAYGPRIVAKFRSRGWASARRMKLLDGTVVSGVGPGHLQIEPGSVRLLRAPIQMAALSGGSANPFGHAHAIGYLLPRPQRFATITKSNASNQFYEVTLPITTKQEWLQIANDQAAQTSEGIKRATEAALVLAYSEYRNARSQRPLVRHRVEIAGTYLFTDAYDPVKNLLVEAKGNSSRPAVRMAIGQLLDYRHAMRLKKPKLAILLPQMPSDDLLDLAASLGIATIWRRPDGSFWDSENGHLLD